MIGPDKARREGGDRGEESLYGYLYRRIKEDIESGAIPAGERLPSKRALAEHLGVSLVTVEGAYGQLVAEGYVSAKPRRGFFANPVDRPATRPRRSAPVAAPAVHGPVAAGVAHGSAWPPAASAGGEVAAELFPYRAWARAMRDVLSHEPERALLCESPSMGSVRLREALAAHLRSFRGMEADPACIVVGAGAQTLYNLLVQLLGRGRRFAVEDPGYPRLTSIYRLVDQDEWYVTSIYRANDVELSHVPLDGAGIGMAALRSSGASVAHLVPSHQFPTGLVTSVSRRYELLGWANDAEGRYVVEDDYDCEFRLAGRPIPSMQSIDASERVIYANTFARSMGPAFRVGYLVLPAHLARRFQSELGFYSCTVSSMEQLALARFIEGGDFERHVRRMRTHYRALRDRLLAALSDGPWGDRLRVEGADAGLHFLLRVDSAATEADLVRAARAEGVALAPLSAFRQASVGSGRCAGAFGEGGAPSFVMSYAGVGRDVVPHAVRALERAFDAAEREAARAGARR